MTDISDEARAGLVAAKADLRQAIEAGEQYVAAIAPPARTEFKVLWAHKLLVLCDVGLITIAFVAGHYI